MARISNPYLPPRRRSFSSMSLIEILVALIIIGILASIVIFAVQSTGESGGDYPNTDPRTGWVHVNDDLEKRCDGTTMLYHDTWNDSYNVAPNAPECGAQ